MRSISTSEQNFNFIDTEFRTCYKSAQANNGSDLLM